MGGSGGHPQKHFSKNKPYFMQSEAFCGVFMKENFVKKKKKKKKVQSLKKVHLEIVKKKSTVFSKMYDVATLDEVL